jgi:hypothetical protein
MSWKELIKSRYTLEMDEEGKSRREGMKEKYSQSSKPQADKCKVESCYAVSCKHNKDKNCMLPLVTLSKEAVCQDFTTEKTLPDAKYQTWMKEE